MIYRKIIKLTCERGQCVLSQAVQVSRGRCVSKFLLKALWIQVLKRRGLCLSLNFLLPGGFHSTHHSMISEFSSIFPVLRVLHFKFHMSAVSEIQRLWKCLWSIYQIESPRSKQCRDLQMTAVETRDLRNSWIRFFRIEI